MNTFSKLIAGFLASCAMLPAVASAENINIVLNWVPTADHMPYFYAKQMGLYEKEGLTVNIESGRGSGAAAQKVGAGFSQFGIADMATVLLAKGQGADSVALMTVYTNSPQGFYWLKSKGIKGPEDFPGHSIGNPPADASRVMWPMFAEAVKIDPAAVKFVNISPQAKVASLKSGAIDITSDFYNEHDMKVREFGDDLGFLAWRDIGINPYGNSVIVNADYLNKNPETVRKFMQVTQKAFEACVKDKDPCIEALLSQVSGLDKSNQEDQWNRIQELMRDKTTMEVGLGAFDDERMKQDYEMVEKYFDLEKPFDIKTAYSNEYLDLSIKMPKE